VHGGMVAWYIDDNKILHAIIEKIEEQFNKMVVTRGCDNLFLE
jgi:hypothetical protein